MTHRLSVPVLGPFLVAALVVTMVWAGRVAAAGDPSVAVVVDPRCASEDSCDADWRDGGWHIDPTVP